MREDPKELEKLEEKILRSISKEVLCTCKQFDIEPHSRVLGEVSLPTRAWQQGRIKRAQKLVGNKGQND